MRDYATALASEEAVSEEDTLGSFDVVFLRYNPVRESAGGPPAPIIDFGWLGIIARPLFLWLKWMYGHIVANWGWAILLQTLVINLALLPLRLSQMKSMLKMQRVAPQIKSIQEKYKKYSLRDPRKAEMNEEISALYKKEGVNPAGGCLPLLIQMPFLFAYYRMLNVAMDLRHAPWMWVKDLSAPDPHYILPISIVVTMFFMQRLTQSGVALHQGVVPNYPASHGCIRMPGDAARKLFAEIPIGTLVTVK